MTITRALKTCECAEKDRLTLALRHAEEALEQENPQDAMAIIVGALTGEMPSGKQSLETKLLLLVSRGYSMTSARQWVVSRRYCSQRGFKTTWDDIVGRGLVAKDSWWHLTDAGKQLLESRGKKC